MTLYTSYILFIKVTTITNINTLSLHDALPICAGEAPRRDSRTPVPSRSRRTAGAFPRSRGNAPAVRSEEHTSELQSQSNLVCRLLLEKKKNKNNRSIIKNSVDIHCLLIIIYIT